jgi:hypothetical protein
MDQPTKSYNTLALKGLDYSDDEFQADMKASGIAIPDELLYTSDLNNFVVNEMYKQNLDKFSNDTNPYTGQKYTEEEAVAEARKYRLDAQRNIDLINSTDKEK